MKHTTKITPAIQRKIAEAAKDLPPMAKVDGSGNPVYRSTVVKGDKLSLDDLKPGTPLNPEASYKINRLQYEDHIMNMVKLVQRDGDGAIAAYAGGVKMRFQEFIDTTAKQKSASTWYKKFINYFKSKKP